MTSPVSLSCILHHQYICFFLYDILTTNRARWISVEGLPSAWKNLIKALTSDFDQFSLVAGMFIFPLVVDALTNVAVILHFISHWQSYYSESVEWTFGTWVMAIFTFFQGKLWFINNLYRDRKVTILICGNGTHLVMVGMQKYER